MKQIGIFQIRQVGHLRCCKDTGLKPRTRWVRAQLFNVKYTNHIFHRLDKSEESGLRPVTYSLEILYLFLLK